MFEAELKSSNLSEILRDKNGKIEELEGFEVPKHPIYDGPARLLDYRYNCIKQQLDQS